MTRLDPAQRKAVVRTAIGVVVAGLIVYAVADAAGGLGDAIHQLHHADLDLLGYVVALQVLRFVSIGEQLRLTSGRPAQHRWVTIRVSTIMFGLGNLLPASPAEGIAMSAAELHRRDLSTRLAVLMLLLAQWMQFWALMLLFVADQVVVHATGELGGDLGGWLGMTAIAVAVISVVTILQARKRTNAVRIALLLRRLPGRYRRTTREATAAGLRWFDDITWLMQGNVNRAKAGLFATIGWMSDGAGLWLALKAVHAHVSFEVVLFGYVVATLVSWVPLLPGGAGAVEAALPAVLHHFGVPLVVGLAGTLLWRGASLFLPAVAGVFSYLSLRVGGRKDLDPDTALAQAESDVSLDVPGLDVAGLDVDVDPQGA